MKFNLDVPSLLDITRAKIAEVLWKDYADQIVEWKLTDNDSPWRKIETEVCAQLDDLIIPRSSKSSIITFVRHMGRQLQEWFFYLIPHVVDYCDNRINQMLTDITRCTRWTVHAKLNWTESTKLLSTSDKFTITEKFHIACVFCIPDAIDHLRKNSRRNLEIDDDLKSLMTNFWNENSAQITDCKKSDMFIECMERKNLCGLEYFWSLMNPRERNDIIRRLLQSEIQLGNLIEQTIEDTERSRGNFGSFGTSVLCFILSKMDDRQIEVVVSSPVMGSSICFPLLLDFNYVDFFTPFLNRFVKDLPEDEFFATLNTMIRMICLGDCLHVYKVKNCLTNFLMNSPSVMKSLVAKDVMESSFPILFVGPSTWQDLVNIELILRDIDVVSRRRVLSRCVSRYDVHRQELNWDLLANVAKQCITTTQELTIFKKNCASIAYKVCVNFGIGEETQWPKVDKFLDFCFPNATEVDKFKQCLAFEYFAKNEKMEQPFIDNFLIWCGVTTPGVKRHLMSTLDVISGSCGVYLNCCLKEDMEMAKILFGNLSVKERRRVLSLTFFQIVSCGYRDLHWDFVEVVARMFISSDKEMSVFKEDCSRIAYRICTVIYNVGMMNERLQLVDRFLKFCFPNAHDIRDFKKGLAYDLVAGTNDFVFDQDDVENEHHILTWCCLTVEEIADFLSIHQFLHIDEM